MNETNEVRRLLDERGVEYQSLETSTCDFTAWHSNGVDAAWDDSENYEQPHLFIIGLTPAQAIAATLGSEDTYTREDVEGAFVSGYSLGLDMFDSSKQEKGWNQNERNMDEEMEDLGWVRKDAVTLGAGTCQLKRANWDDGTCTWGCICSACDAHLEHETGIGYNYCPICGARIVEVDE